MLGHTPRAASEGGPVMIRSGVVFSSPKLEPEHNGPVRFGTRSSRQLGHQPSPSSDSGAKPEEMAAAPREPVTDGTTGPGRPGARTIKAIRRGGTSRRLLTVIQ